MADLGIGQASEPGATGSRTQQGRRGVIAAVEQVLSAAAEGERALIVVDGPNGSAVVVGAAPPGDDDAAERARLHARAAQVLHQDGAASAQVADHLLRAGRLGEPWHHTVLRAAAAEALARAEHGRAVELLRAALSCCPDEPRPEVLAELGRAELATGDPSAADHLVQAVTERPELAGDPAFALALGQALYTASRFADAADAFERGLASPVHRQADTEAQLLAGLNMASMLAGRLIERTPDATLSAGDRWLATRVRAAIAAGRCALGVGVPESERRRSRVLELVDLAMPDGLPPEGVGTVVLEPLTLALWAADDVDRAGALLETVLADPEAPRHGEATLLPIRAMVRLAAGDVPGASSDAHRTIELSRALARADHQTAMAAGHVLAHVGLATGRIDDVAPVVDQLEHLVGFGASPLRGWLLEARGQLALAAGDPATARTLFLAAGDAFRLASGPGSYVAWRTGAARATLALARRDEAAELLAEELDLARDFGSQRILSGALRASAQLHRRQAVDLLRKANTVLAGAPLELDRARAEVELGAALCRRNARRDARRILRTGLERARACGADAVVVQARTELDRAGARDQARPSTGHAALTPAERRVARLAAGGRSNPEIADALFVSRKTVEVHLSSIYRKLGIRGRTELPRP